MILINTYTSNSNSNIYFVNVLEVNDKVHLKLSYVYNAVNSSSLAVKFLHNRLLTIMTIQWLSNHQKLLLKANYSKQDELFWDQKLEEPVQWQLIQID